jgi:hypothetical protein
MTRTRFLKTAGVISAFAAIVLVAMLNNSKRGRARDDDGGARGIQGSTGLRDRSCSLESGGENRALVGWGSYIVNAQGGRQPTQDRALSMNSVT